jgi:hypothetical protein
MLTGTQFADICQRLLSSEDISYYEANLIYHAVHDIEFPYKNDLVAIASKFKNIGAIGSGNAADTAYALLRSYSHNTFTSSQFEILVNTCSLPVAFNLIQNKSLPVEFFYSFKQFEHLDKDTFIYNKDFIAKALKENFYYFRRQKSMSIISSIRNKLSQEGTNADALTDELILKVYGVEGFTL